MQADASQIKWRSALLPSLLALATVLSTATKLRLPGLPVGAGELLLLAWLSVSACVRALSTGFLWPMGLALRWGVLFLLFVGCTLLIGAGLAQTPMGPGLVGTGHEAIAWAFILPLTLWFLLEAQPASAVLRFLERFAGTAALAAGALFAVALVARVATGSDALWYGGMRLAGWAENPNQLALLLAPVPFLAIHFRRAANSTRARAWSGAIVTTGMAGFATLSDALLLSWVLGGFVLIVSAWITGIIGAHRTARSVIANALAIPLLLALFVVLFGNLASNLFTSIVEARAGEGGQASTRLTLWNHGMSAAFRSPLVGWGPGAHSGFNGPFEGVESHSTFIDLATQAGFPVAIALAAIILGGIARALRTGSLPLALAVGSVAIIATFHNVLRQPIFWFVVFGIVAACSIGNAGARHRPYATLPLAGPI